MSNYDPSELNDEAESAEPPAKEAVITDVTATTAGEVYGGDTDFSYDPDRPMIEVTAEVESGEEISEVMGLPESESSWFNPNFKLGQYKNRYGSVPHEGQEVETTINEDTGFLEIDY